MTGLPEDDSVAVLLPDASDGLTTGTAERPSAARRVVVALGRHPVLVASMIGLAVAVAQAWWIWTYRHVGGFDPDEVSYLATALRIHRSVDPAHPFAFVAAMGSSGHGITVPTLSLPFLIMGPRDPRTAMMLQPALLVFIAAATAGITRRLANDWAAIVASLWVVVLPTVVTAVQSYWYGLGAAAALAGAMWALLASDGGRNRSIWWFGVGIGAMLGARTMTLGYLPAAALAGLVVAWPDRRGLRRVAAATSLGIGIAAPWYLVNRTSIFGYLFSFGYGDRAALFGETGFWDRVSLRLERYEQAFQLNGLFHFGLAVTALCLVRVLRGRSPKGLEARYWVAVFAAVSAGTAALVSTANNGVWFELPMVVLLVPLLVAAVAQLWKPLSLAAGVLVLSIGWYEMPARMWLKPWEPRQFAPVGHYELGFSEYDERFAPSTRELHATAADDWAALSRSIEHELRRISPDGRRTFFVFTGNTHLWNAGTVRMAAELDSWDPVVIIPDTTLPAAERAGYLGPRVREPGEPERVLIVGLHDQILWPLDADVRSFLSQAERSGFRETIRFRMPRGGYVAILRQE